MPPQTGQRGSKQTSDNDHMVGHTDHITATDLPPQQLLPDTADFRGLQVG